MISQLNVFWLALMTAIATGLGVVPFLFSKTYSNQFLGACAGISAALMLVASFGMIGQGTEIGLIATLGGMMVGLVFILVASQWLDRYEHLKFEGMNGLNAKKALLLVGVMFVHSFCEGVAIGVSFGPSVEFGIFIALVMAIQNIPEGLAISLTMVPKGVSRWKASLWSIFTSLPQPLMAVPAFIIVQQFPRAVPFGLGFAAGAMIWMSFSELLPDALRDTPKDLLATIITVSIALMILVEGLLKVM